MNGFEYYENYFRKKFNLKSYIFYLILLIGILFFLSGAIYSFNKQQWPSFIAFSVCFIIILLLFVIPYFIFFVILPWKRKKEQKTIADQLGLDSKINDLGLMLEKDFNLEPGEKKVKYLPAVWYGVSIKKSSRYVKPIYRVSLMITNKRIIIPGPKGISLYFSRKGKKDENHFWFICAEKTKYPGDMKAMRYIAKKGFNILTKENAIKTIKDKGYLKTDIGEQKNSESLEGAWLEGLKVWYHIPEKNNKYLYQLIPTDEGQSYGEKGFVVDNLSLFPKDINRLKEIIKSAFS